MQQLKNPPSCGGPPGARGGFSLVELIYVMIIIGIIATIALPRVDVGRSSADAAALELGSVLLVAQRTAVMEQHDVRVLVDTADHSVMVHQDDDNDGTRDSSERATRRELPERAIIGLASSDPLLGSGPVSFESGSEGLPVIVYRRNGAASEEGVVHVTSRSGDPNDDRAIRVERATGLSRCWSRRTGSWKEGC